MTDDRGEDQVAMDQPTISAGRWRVRVDRVATRRAYAGLRAADLPVALCTCAYCRNFALAQPALFPPEARVLFDRLGIDARYPSEVVHYYRIEPGAHAYGGWFHLIGRLLEGEPPADRQSSPVDAAGRLLRDAVAWGENFALRFTVDYRPRPAVFDDVPLVALEFECVVPWLLDAPEPV